MQTAPWASWRLLFPPGMRSLMGQQSGQPPRGALPRRPGMACPLMPGRSSQFDSSFREGKREEGRGKKDERKWEMGAAGDYVEALGYKRLAVWQKAHAFLRAVLKISQCNADCGNRETRNIGWPLLSSPSSLFPLPSSFDYPRHRSWSRQKWCGGC